MNKIEQLESLLALIERIPMRYASPDGYDDLTEQEELNLIEALELSLEIAKGDKFVGEWKAIKRGEEVHYPAHALLGYAEGDDYLELAEYFCGDRFSHIAQFNNSPVIPTPKETV